MWDSDYIQQRLGSDWEVKAHKYLVTVQPISSQLLCLLSLNHSSLQRPTCNGTKLKMSERKWRWRSKSMYTHNQTLPDVFVPIRIITMSIHVRHEMFVCSPSGRHCCLRWCGELSLQWVVGLNACSAADSLCLCVNVLVKERGRVGWHSTRGKHKRASP